MSTSYKTLTLYPDVYGDFIYECKMLMLCDIHSTYDYRKDIYQKHVENWRDMVNKYLNKIVAKKSGHVAQIYYMLKRDEYILNHFSQLINELVAEGALVVTINPI